MLSFTVNTPLQLVTIMQIAFWVCSGAATASHYLPQVSSFFSHVRHYKGCARDPKILMSNDQKEKEICLCLLYFYLTEVLPMISNYAIPCFKGIETVIAAVIYSEKNILMSLQFYDRFFQRFVFNLLPKFLPIHPTPSKMRVSILSVAFSFLELINTP